MKGNKATLNKVFYIIDFIVKYFKLAGMPLINIILKLIKLQRTTQPYYWLFIKGRPILITTKRPPRGS